ncbi:MAG: hypothetical protein Tsb0014_20200 [Pleurocapsa sp.]
MTLCKQEKFNIFFSGKQLTARIKKRIEFEAQRLSIVSFINGLIKLAIKGQLPWLIFLAECRLTSKINALYHGLRLNQDLSGSLYQLRRNIHRIEKGLSYQKLKSFFAEDYILETVNILNQIKANNPQQQNTIDWSEAVLNEYFKICQHTPQIKKAYDLYQTVSIKNNQPNWYPYCEKNRPNLTINYENLYQLALRRRSVRFYLERTVSFDVIEKAMEVAALSPSACNRQAFKFLFYNQKNIISKISKIPGGINGYELPSIIILVGSYRAYFDERDINAPIIDASLAAMAFQFALETLGLSSVCINWPNVTLKDKQIRQIIDLAEDEFVIMLMGVGYPDPNGKIAYSAKKNIDQLVSCNQKIK